MVILQEISLGVGLQNLCVRESGVDLDPEGGGGEFWNAFSLRCSGNFSTVYSVLEEIAVSKPASLMGKLELRFNEHMQRVEIVCDECRVMLARKFSADSRFRSRYYTRGWSEPGVEISRSDCTLSIRTFVV